MIPVAICLLADMFLTALLVHTYIKLLETRRERDEARERLRHATSELEGHSDFWRSVRNGELRKLARLTQASAEYLKNWN